MALDVLKSAGWNLQRSLDTYFNNSNARAPVRSASKTDKRSIDRLWNKYRGTVKWRRSHTSHSFLDPDGDMMSAHGVGQFCEDLDVDPSDISLVSQDT